MVLSTTNYWDGRLKYPFPIMTNILSVPHRIPPIGIPVDRSRKTSLVDQMIKIAKSSQKFHLAITPEGTRKANPNWKKGFYYIAQGAGLPIILVAIDYEKKCITAEKVIHPSGDLDKDMREVKLYYKNFKGKYPENFSIGKVE